MRCAVRKVKQRRSADFTWRRLGSLNAGVDTLRPTCHADVNGIPDQLSLSACWYLMD